MNSSDIGGVSKCERKQGVREVGGGERIDILANCQQVPHFDCFKCRNLYCRSTFHKCGICPVIYGPVGHPVVSQCEGPPSHSSPRVLDLCWCCYWLSCEYFSYHLSLSFASDPYLYFIHLSQMVRNINNGKSR